MMDVTVSTEKSVSPAAIRMARSRARRRRHLRCVTIEVRDRGPGFPPAFLPYAFERFARPDLGRARDSGGAGLGLAIVQAITQAHGGRAVAGNRPGGGAVVRLEIPGPPGPPP